MGEESLGQFYLSFWFLVPENLRFVRKTHTEDILKATVGDFGRWQLKISILMALLKFPMAWFQMSIVFLAPPTQFWCKQERDFENLTHIEWIDLIKPVENASFKQEGLNKGYCFMKDVLNSTNETVPCTNGYEYSKAVFESTITSEWNLVCGHQRLADLSQVVFMFGVLIGNLICGFLADKKGRKHVLLFCLLFQTIFGVAASFVPWFWLFVILRFFLAVACGGTMITSFVVCMEVVGGKWRTIVPTLYQLPYAFGYSALSGISYLLRDWRHMHLALSGMSGIFILYIWLIPESPRWLLAVGKKDEALAILKKAAIENGKNKQVLDRIITDLSNSEIDKSNKKAPIKDLFLTRELRKRTSLIVLNWTLTGLTFYAFSQYSGHISENIFVVMAITGLVAIPGTILCVFLVGRYGRRYTLVIGRIVTAICFVVILLIPQGAFAYDWPRVLFSGICITGISMSLPALYLFTGELYPTVLRNAGVGFASMCSRLASMVSPLILGLQEVSPYLPLAFMAVVTLIEAVAILPLPETNGRPLPDTLEDLKKRDTRKRQFVPSSEDVRNIYVY